MAVHCTASGKLLMAFGPDDLQKNFLRLAPFPARTKKTITTARAFARELDQIRKRGFAEDDQELLAGVNCLAVPIYNRAGEVVAGLAVMAPAATLPLEKLRGHLAEIRNCATTISRELGGQGDPPSGTVVAMPPRRGNRKQRAVSSKRGAARVRGGHATAPPVTR